MIDEVANVAPLSNLDTLASTASGHGIQLLTVWQDFAQIEARYGTRSATVINNHRAKLIFPGISDPATLDWASRLIGDSCYEVERIDRRSTGRGLDHRRRVRAPPGARRFNPHSRCGRGCAPLRQPSASVGHAPCVGQVNRAGDRPSVQIDASSS